MTALLALTKAIRSTLVFAVVAALAFGSLAAPLAAAQYEPAGHSIDKASSHATAATGVVVHDADKCLSGFGHDMGKHGTDDGACCNGSYVMIVSAATVPLSPAFALSEIEPFHAALLARSRFVEFLRPPSLTI